MALASPFQEYLSALRTPATRRTYKCHAIKIGDPDQFLALAQTEKLKAEKKLLEFVIKEREKVSAMSVSLTITAYRQFLEFNDVNVN